MKCWYFSLIVILNLLFSDMAYGEQIISPSFDCKKAATDVEKDICSHPKTAELDKKVATAFFDLKKNPNGRLIISVNELLQNQKEWLKSRGDDNCSSECLQEKYQERLDELTFPGAPLPLTDAKVNELINYFKDKSCESLPQLNDTKIFQTDGLNDFVCKAFEVNNKLANKLFSNCFGSNRDNFIPSCDYSAQIKKIDGLKEYTNLLSKLHGQNGAMCGTIRYGYFRQQNSAVLNTIYSTEFLSAETKKTEELPRFSLQGLWQKDQYQQFIRIRDTAEKGIEKYYALTRHVLADKAKTLAANNVSYLARVYIDNHAGSHGQWDLSNLNSFLKDGTLPTVTKDQAKPEILANFLRFALVNNYSKNDIEKIIAAGANLNSKSTDEYDTALMNAVKRIDLLKLLLDKGTDVNAQNSFGKTALMYAIQYGNIDSVKMLVENKANVNLATFTSDLSNCAHELSAGNRTPLMYAAWHASDEVVKYLLAHGANADAKDTEGHDYKYYFAKNSTFPGSF